MAVFTVAPEFIESICIDELYYFTDVLLVFTRRNNNHKVAKDRSGIILDHYSEITVHRDLVKHWLDLMTFKPSPFEIVDIDLNMLKDRTTRTLALCKATLPERKLVVYNKTNVQGCTCIDGTYFFDDCELNILDRDDIRVELQSDGTTVVQNISGSQVATNGGTIKSSTIKNQSDEKDNKD